MMTAAIATPINIDRVAFFKSISNKAAIKHPVQAPVPGNGIPTNNANPQKPYLSIFGLFLIAFCSNHSAIFDKWCVDNQ